jgi:hypothetical protein
VDCDGLGLPGDEDELPGGLEGGWPGPPPQLPPLMVQAVGARNAPDPM